MNEEALLYSFDLFSKDGYNGSQKEYIQLLGENIQALQHSYKLFQKDGYDGTIDDFSEIIGVKKKEVLQSGLESGNLDSTLQNDIQIQTGEDDTAIERTFGKNFLTDFLGDIYRAGEQGVAQGATLDDAMKLFSQGKEISDEDLQEYIRVVQEMESYSPSDEMKDFDKIYQKEGGGLKGFIYGLANNPSVIPQLFTSSVLAMINPTTALGAGAGALIGAGTGAALGGGVLSGITAGGGAVAGAIGGMSGILEAGLSYTEFLKEELQAKGVEFNDEGIRKVLNDEDAVASIVNKSLARGVSIAAIDALSGGLATKVTAGIARKTIGKVGKLAAATAGGAVEAVGGSLGEATARAVTGQEMDVAEIGFEGVAGTATAPITVARGLIQGAPKYTVGKNQVSKERLQKIIETSTPEQLAEINIDIKNDPDLQKFRNTKFKEGVVRNQIKQAMPDVSDAVLNNITSLQMELDSLEDNNTVAAKKKKADIKNQITELMQAPVKQEVKTTKEEALDSLKEKGITEPTDRQVLDELDLLNKNKLDAIQEPITETVDVSEPTGDSKTVGEGDTTIGVTEEVTPQEATDITEDQKAKEEAKLDKVTSQNKIIQFIDDAKQEMSSMELPKGTTAVITEKEGVVKIKFEKIIKGKKSANKLAPISVLDNYEIDLEENDLSLENEDEIIGVREIRKMEGSRTAATITVRVNDGEGNFSTFEADILLKDKESTSPTQEKLDKVTSQKVKDLVTAPRAIPKPFIVASATGRPSKTQINFTEDGKIESIVNKDTGKEVSKTTKRRVEKIYLTSIFDVNEAETLEFPEGLAEVDADDFVLKNSKNAVEVALTINAEKNKRANLITEEQYNLFDPEGFRGFKIKKENFERFNDKNNLDEDKEIEKNWFDENAIPIDSRIQSLPKYTKENADVLIKKFIDFIIDNPRRFSDVKEKVLLSLKKSEMQFDLESKFKDITGVDATPTNISTVLSIDPDRGPLTNEQKQSLIDYERAIVEQEGEMQITGKKVSAKKIVEGAPKMVTVDEVKALNDQIRLKARESRASNAAQKEARQFINDKIQEMSSKGKINSRQAKSVINKLSKVNLYNEAAVQKVLDYADKVFTNAEFITKLKTAEATNKAARENLRSGDLGLNANFNSALSMVLNIPLDTLTNENIDAYTSFISKFSSRKSPISLQQAETLTQEAVALYNDVYIFEDVIDEETVKRTKKDIDKVIKDINSPDVNAQDLIDKHSDFILNKLDSINSITLYNLVDKINELDYAENKEIIDSVNDYAENRNSLIEEASSVDVKLTEIDELSKTPASRYKQLTKIDFIDLTGKQLQDAIINMDNINNGFYTFPANTLMQTIESNKRSKEVVPILSKLDSSKVDLGATRIYGKIKSAFTKRSAMLESVRSNPLNVIDDVFGNFSGREISNNVFEPIASSLAKYEAQISNVLARVLKIEDNLASTIKESKNTEVERSYSVTYYLLKKEHESNNNKIGTANPADFVDATVEDFEKNPSKSIYSENDIQILEKIKKDNENKTAKEIFDSFSNKTKSAVEDIETIYKENEAKATWTATIVRGDGIDMVNNYVHHKVGTNKTAASTDVNNHADAILNPSTKSKAAISRTAGAKSIDFDPISTLMRATRYTLLDYNLTDEVKIGNKTVNKIKEDISLEPESTKLQKEGANAILGAYTEALENVLLSNFTEYNFATRAIDKVRTIGYQAALASIPRAASEALSNLSYVLTASPAEFTLGLTRHTNLSFGQNGLDIVRNVGSKTFTKLYGEEKLAGSKAEASGLVRGKKGASRATNKLGGVVEYLSRGARIPAKVSTKIAEALISTPDKAISRPLFFGTFATEFKKQTGLDVDFDKISNNDKDYLIENKEAIKKSREVADVAVQRAATTNSRMDVILKNQIKPSDNAYIQIYKTMNSYMSRFAINEYATARQAVASMMGAGEMTKVKGFQTIVALNFRMASYLILGEFFGTAFKSLFGVDDDDTEDYEEKAKRAVLGSAVSLMSRRTLGNAAMLPINLYIEKLNKDHGQGLRDNKKYDPYKHSIVYNQIIPEKFYRDPSEKILQLLSGPSQPTVKASLRIINVYGKYDLAKTKREKKKYMDELISLRTAADVLGNTGLLPFYRDIRSVILAKEYESINKGISKSDLKKFLPDVYNKMYGPGSSIYKIEQKKKELKQKRKNQ